MVLTNDFLYWVSEDVRVKVYAFSCRVGGTGPCYGRELGERLGSGRRSYLGHHTLRLSLVAQFSLPFLHLAPCSSS